MERYHYYEVILLDEAMDGCYSILIRAEEKPSLDKAKEMFDDDYMHVSSIREVSREDAERWARRTKRFGIEIIEIK